MYSLNPEGTEVTHFDAFGDRTPLCGWISTKETAVTDWSLVDCRDCQAAR